MTLRRRLILTMTATAVPLLGGLVWVRGQMIGRATEAIARDIVISRMQGGGREQCEADPASFIESMRRRTPWGASGRFFVQPGPGPIAPPRPSRGFFDGGPPRFERRLGPPPGPIAVYDSALQPPSPEIPPLDEGLRRQLAAGRDIARTTTGGGTQVAVRMPWKEGPCAVVLSSMPTPRAFEASATWLPSAAFLCAAFAAAVWLSAGSAVRRIRTLTEAARRSALGQYETSVALGGRDEVAELAQAFNDAGLRVREQVTALEEREATLRSFITNTTHDVMLPLTVLQGHLSRLRRGQLDDGAHDAALAAAQEEADYVASLLHNLSAVAKLEAGGPALRQDTFDLAAVVERVVERHRTVASAKGLEMGHAVPEAAVWISGDLTLVEQATGNLVHNAVRYNSAGGHVAVVLDECPNGRFLLRVSDDGPGVQADQLAHLGERRFRTEEARQRQPDGLGIGLSIAADVARRHGFTLRFAPNEPRGLVAELEGPRATAPDPPEA